MNKKPVALVTGASRGIGRAITVELAGRGYDLVGVARTLESTGEKAGLEDLRHLVEASGASFLPIRADVGDVSYHRSLIEEVEGAFGRIDLLVNNAGVAPERRVDLLEAEPESFDRVLSINLRGPFFLTQAVAEKMLEHRKGLKDYNPKIVFITSISARVSSTDRGEYCVAKAGTSMVAALFADRLAGEGINVYEIRPGIIETDMTAAAREKYDKLIGEGLVPMRRWGKPEDIARAVASLARGDFDYATGTIIELSGGMGMRRL